MDSGELLGRFRSLIAELTAEKRRKFNRRVALGDLLSERADNARACGFGPGTTMYDNVLVLGDVLVGCNTWIGPNVILDGAGGLSIGDFCSISAGVQIYSHHSVKWSISMGQAPIERAATEIGSGVYIGPNAIVQMGTKIGDRAVIGACAIVNRDVPPGARVFGMPAREAPPSRANISGDPGISMG